MGPLPQFSGAVLAALFSVACLASPEAPELEMHGAAARDASAHRVSTLPKGVHPAHHEPETCQLCALYDLARESTFVVLSDGGLGTAVLIGPEGLAVTNAHVVGNSKVVTIARFGGKKAQAAVLSVDATEDLALLRIENIEPEIAPLEFRVEPPRVGSAVYAVGHPLGLGWTVSSGIVSGLQVLDGRPMVQTDTPISPGNSGGPLLGTQGHIVGIVTQKVNGGGAENIAFARPSEVVLEFLRKAGVTIEAE